MVSSNAADDTKKLPPDDGALTPRVLQRSAMCASPAGLPPYVGRYQVSAHLSGGLLDDVYKGFDPLLERPVIIRIFPLRFDDPAVAAGVKQVFYGQMERAGALMH